MNQLTPPPDAPYVSVQGMTIRYPVQRSLILNRPTRFVTAVNDIDLAIRSTETYALVGESGSGKSSAGRGVLALEPLAGGTVSIAGIPVSELTSAQLRSQRRTMQMVFQDPLSSLNPRETIGKILERPLMVSSSTTAAERSRTVVQTLDLVGLGESALARYPHELSGGQRQRVGIGRAIIGRPTFLVADEPVSALDVSVQAQIINVLEDVREELGVTMLFISHDLGVVRHVSDRVGVMYLGTIVEEADTDTLFDNPQHPYTKALMSAAPIPDPARDTRERIILRGEIPSPLAEISGCRFASRCPVKHETRCDDEVPQLREVPSGGRVACHWV